MKKEFFPKMLAFLSSLDFSQISQSRKIILNKAADELMKHYSKGELHLVFVCTHNSRRSQFGQSWAAIAASYFELNIPVFSAGTEATACFSETINALKRTGCEVEKESNNSQNPEYVVSWGNNQSTTLFSKDLQHDSLPKENFVAIMTCDDADQNCPVVLGSSGRIPLTYTDPKNADSTPSMQATYDKTCNLIACEIFYLFNQLTK